MILCVKHLFGRFWGKAPKPLYTMTLIPLIEAANMGRRQHYKWSATLEALKDLNRTNKEEYFPSIVIAEKASILGRRNSEISSRQVGAILKYYQHQGLVESRIVRKNNCKHHIWRIKA